MTKPDTSLQILTDTENLPDAFAQGQAIRSTLEQLYMLLLSPSATVEAAHDLIVAADDQLSALTNRANQSAAVERGLVEALVTIREQRNDLVAQLAELEDGFEERVEFELSAHWAGEKQRQLDVKRLANEIADAGFDTVHDREDDKLYTKLREARERAEWFAVPDDPDADPVSGDSNEDSAYA